MQSVVGASLRMFYCVAMGICYKDTNEKRGKPSASKHVDVVTKNDRERFEPGSFSSKACCYEKGKPSRIRTKVPKVQMTLKGTKR